MEQEYLTNYIQNNKISDDLLASSLRFELDRRIFHYGEHFKDSVELSSHSLSARKIIRNLVIDLKVVKDKIFKKKLTNSVVSGAYVSANSIIKSSQLEFITPPWIQKLDQYYYPSLKLFNRVNTFTKMLQKNHYNFFTTTEFSAFYKNLKKEFLDFYSNPEIKAIVLSNDIGFYEVLSLRIFKDLRKKSFLYIHGIPGHYSKKMYAKSDYLLVWGEALKKNFIDIGFDSEKVKVVGHPHLKPSGLVVKSSLENVLVLGSSVPGGQLDEDQVMLWDRGNIILYCYLVQDALKTLGVKKAKLRPHPAESKDWYKKFIDLDFYEMDSTATLNESIQQSTLLIGPTSTSLIESLNLGVNYITFEPFYNEGSYLRYKLVAPFDKSDKRVLVATNASELNYFLQNNSVCDKSVVSDYLSSEYLLEETISKIIFESEENGKN